MSIEFWISIILSIPLGIASALLTPFAQKVWIGRNKKRLIARKLKGDKEFLRITYYKSNPHFFTQYLLLEAVEIIILVVATMFLIALVFFTQFLEIQFLSFGAFTKSQLFSVVFTVISTFFITKKMKKCYFLWNKIILYETYRKEYEEQQASILKKLDEGVAMKE